MSRILDFQDGFSSANEPNQGLITATALRQFANDAAFVTFKGSAAANGDIYYNTTDDTQRMFLNGSWQEMVDTTNAQSISGIKTFVNDVVMSANLTVNGTTTTINTTNLDVTDKNINLNDGGNDASSEGAGLNIERTGTDGSFVYEDALASKFKLGALAAEIEVANVSSSQTLTNKTMAFGSNTFTGFPGGDLTVVTKTTTATLSSADQVTLVDATSADFTVTLPTAGTGGILIRITKTTAANIVTIEGDGSDTIIGELNQTLTTQWTSVGLISDGSTNWIVT